MWPGGVRRASILPLAINFGITLADDGERGTELLVEAVVDQIEPLSWFATTVRVRHIDDANEDAVCSVDAAVLELLPERDIERLVVEAMAEPLAHARHLEREDYEEARGWR